MPGGAAEPALGDPPSISEHWGQRAQLVVHMHGDLERGHHVDEVPGCLHGLRAEGSGCCVSVSCLLSHQEALEDSHGLVEVVGIHEHA